MAGKLQYDVISWNLSQADSQVKYPGGDCTRGF